MTLELASNQYIPRGGTEPITYPPLRPPSSKARELSNATFANPSA